MNVVINLSTKGDTKGFTGGGSVTSMNLTNEIEHANRDMPDLRVVDQPQVWFPLGIKPAAQDFCPCAVGMSWSINWVNARRLRFATSSNLGLRLATTLDAFGPSFLRGSPCHPILHRPSSASRNPCPPSSASPSAVATAHHLLTPLGASPTPVQKEERLVNRGLTNWFYNKLGNQSTPKPSRHNATSRYLRISLGASQTKPSAQK